MANQLPEELNNYLRKMEMHEHPILLEMEALAKENGFPIIGHQCGRILATLAKSVNAKRVFEMGSGYGYSTLWFALAVGPDGRVVHTDGDPMNTEKAKEYLAKAGVIDRVTFITGDALKIVMDQEPGIDVILCDIDKKDYPLALQLAVPKLRVGGWMITHNTVWSGRVADETTDDPATKGIMQFNWESAMHPELLSFNNPVDDGLTCALKVPAEVREGLPFKRNEWQSDGVPTVESV